VPPLKLPIYICYIYFFDGRLIHLIGHLGFPAGTTSSILFNFYIFKKKNTIATCSFCASLSPSLSLSLSLSFFQHFSSCYSPLSRIHHLFPYNHGTKLHNGRNLCRVVCHGLRIHHHSVSHARGADSVLYRAKLLVVSRVGAVGRAEFKVWTGPPGTLSTGLDT
jgi:hypothetical protein